MGDRELASWVLAVVIVGALAVIVKMAPTEPADAYERPGYIGLRENRAYDGAPPTVPHEVAGLGRSDCLDCHAQGDAVAAGEQAKPSPHPELERCQQCHLAQVADHTFRPNSYDASWAYPLGSRAQPMGPWEIPHPLTMRENCLGCHGPEGDERALRTTHPERIRCEQCHIPAQSNYPGPRPDAESDPWQTVR